MRTWLIVVVLSELITTIQALTLGFRDISPPSWVFTSSRRYPFNVFDPCATPQKVSYTPSVRAAECMHLSVHTMMSTYRRAVGILGDPEKLSDAAIRRIQSSSQAPRISLWQCGAQGWNRWSPWPRKEATPPRSPISPLFRSTLNIIVLIHGFHN